MSLFILSVNFNNIDYPIRQSTDFEVLSLKMDLLPISIVPFFLDYGMQKSSTFYVDFSLTLFLVWISSNDSPYPPQILSRLSVCVMDIFPSIMGYTLSLLLLQDRVPIHVWLSLLYYSCFWCIYLSTDNWHILMDYSCIACTLVGSLLYMSMFDCLDIYTSHSVHHTHIISLAMAGVLYPASKHTFLIWSPNFSWRCLYAPKNETLSCIFPGTVSKLNTNPCLSQNVYCSYAKHSSCSPLW